MSIKFDEECTVDAWAEQTRKMLEEFIAMAKRNNEYPASALPGEWDEWFLAWEGE